jgi:hypothetical protein
LFRDGTKQLGRKAEVGKSSNSYLLMDVSARYSPERGSSPSKRSNACDPISAREGASLPNRFRQMTLGWVIRQSGMDRETTVTLTG